MEMLYYTVDIFSLHIQNYGMYIKMTESVNVFVLYNLCVVPLKTATPSFKFILTIWIPAVSGCLQIK